MYLPSVPPPRNENPPTTPHLHQQHETLTDVENDHTFRLYLNGRASAYDTVIDELNERLTKLEGTSNSFYTTDNHRTILTGQIEAVKEILQLLKNSKERNA